MVHGRVAVSLQSAKESPRAGEGASVTTQGCCLNASVNGRQIWPRAAPLAPATGSECADAAFQPHAAQPASAGEATRRECDSQRGPGRRPGVPLSWSRVLPQHSRERCELSGRGRPHDSSPACGHAGAEAAAERGTDLTSAQLGNARADKFAVPVACRMSAAGKSGPLLAPPCRACAALAAAATAAQGASTAWAGAFVIELAG
jgi:hypothetical protein